jgi:hypothetical protein
MANSMKKHPKTTKGVIHYTRGTMSFGIQHTNSSNSVLTSFCDSYWVGNSNGKRSIITYDFNIGTCVNTWNGEK